MLTGMRGAGNNLEEQVTAIERGSAWREASAWRRFEVSGTDAARWLNDLLATDLDGIAPGEVRRSLVLSPTGKVRADVDVLRLEGSFVLVQDPRQSEGIEQALAPYVLSSDVRISPSEAALVLSADTSLAPGSAGRLRPADRRDSRVDLWTEVREEAVEVWRIRHGIPRFPQDLGVDPLPAEAGLDAFIGFEKGCFLGQESARMIRDRGKTPFAVIAFHSDEPVGAGDPVISRARRVGYVTSAAPQPEGSSTAGLARVRRPSVSDRLTTASGSPIYLLAHPA
jgi:folate-binding protein YgfZ